MTNEKANRRALSLLAAGSLFGILLGAVVVAHESGSTTSALPDGAIALVNGKPLREEEYARAVALVERDKRTEITDGDRARVLDRLIEEELLIQRGIEIGLVDSDRSVRKAITQAMLAAIVAESTSAAPSEDDLRAFYTKNASLFTRATGAATDQIVTASTATELPAFEGIREQVEGAYLQRSRDAALREYLEWLRDEAKIVLAPGAHE
ncbi:MAG TPA: hypothetical protein VGX03_23225 [Candidatus Binatia bacterium]|jgi:hypothetical protein|nr:hypothetical protein [Candidatus Binatia bacterium]